MAFLEPRGVRSWTTGTPIQVKQKDKVGRPDIDAFFRKSGKAIIALTVREILVEEIARKLA